MTLNPQVVVGVETSAAAVALGLVLYGVGLRLLARLDGQSHSAVGRRGRRPLALFATVVTVAVALPGLRLSPALYGAVRHVLWLALIALLAWAVVEGLGVVQVLINRHYDVTGQDNLEARKIQTRFIVLHRSAAVLVSVLAAAAMLMTFPQVRLLGGSLLASAGLVGVIAGFAAQPVLTNLLAGLQIALIQPIRIDDVVVVNGDWGRVEEINLAYVVVRIWDLRRLVLPLTYFLQQPFENWTYREANLLGYVVVYADYMVDVGALRQELERLLRASPEWDGKTWNLQMTDADERTVQLRALFGTRNSDDRWNLMVRVREGLIEYLRTHAPQALPRTRLRVDRWEDDGPPRT